MNSISQIAGMEWWGLGIGILIIFMFSLIIIIFAKIKRFEKEYVALQTFMSGESLDKMLKDYLNKMGKIENDLEEINKRLERTEIKLRRATDFSSLIRFNAFENMGSDLSFSLALLNQEGTGLVLSSMNSREESRVYAKPIEKKESVYPLTEEEREVIKKALEGPKI